MNTSPAPLPLQWQWTLSLREWKAFTAANRSSGENSSRPWSSPLKYPGSITTAVQPWMDPSATSLMPGTRNLSVSMSRSLTAASATAS